MNITSPGLAPAEEAARRNLATLVIALAAIALFVVIGSDVVPKTLANLARSDVAPHPVLVTTMLLNIALVMIGWSRYRQLESELEQHRSGEAEARILAETDPLTGFLNRRSLTAESERILAESALHQESVAFLVLDLDNFKSINDFHGHSAGDAILQECARRIEATLPARAIAARLGGDEFACLIPFEAARPEQVDRLAAQLIEQIALPVGEVSSGKEITASIGVSRSDSLANRDSSVSPSQALLQLADIAMYHAKKQGKNRYAWFEAPMESELRFRRELENGIRLGIPGGEFVPYYEQQIDLDSGKLAGFEMLARWKSPKFGIVSPEVFIPIAEEIGLIGELSTGIIAQALIDAKAWSPDLTLSVNISPIQLRDPWFSQKLLKLLVEANFPPQRLEIEITESCLHENVAVVRTLLSSLRNQGVKISLDDFGTGYSSLAQLRSLPFDRNKIDRSFVTNMYECKDSETIVKTITSLGEGLGLPISVEGIETEEVLEQLRGYGDLKGQGFLYGRPEPADETAKRLAGLDLLAQGMAPPLPDAPTINTPRKVANG